MNNDPTKPATKIKSAQTPGAAAAPHHASPADRQREGACADLNPPPPRPRRRALLGLASLLAPAACGGGGGGSSPAPPTPQPVADIPSTRAEAVRFLNQTTLGVKDADIDHLMQVGFSAWLDEQFAMPVQHNHVAHVTTMAARVSGAYANRPTPGHMNNSMWLGMMKSDLLRQRIMFALSQIFVVSLREGSTLYSSTGLAAYVDMLYAKGFSNWRELIESVALSPAMGVFLSHIYNRKEDPLTGAVPDQNFAREVMQLFSIGLWQLNRDGSRKLDAQGQPIPTYGVDDIVGVSRVLTGWAYDAASAADWSNYYSFWSAADMPVQARPMRAFPAYHSTREKKFLGVTIAATSNPDPAGNLAILLNTLFNHANTAPFFCKQMIQRLVTSNPSPAYLTRVVDKFENNGQGQRGDLKAVIKAVLLDPEARNQSSVSWTQFGRVREQILRMCNIMRTFNAATGVDPLGYGVPLWVYDRSKGLWQTPLGSDTVFNFFFPDYTPGTSALSQQGLIAPEMQIVTQSSVSDTQFFFLDLLQNAGLTDCCSPQQRNTFHLRLDYADWLPLVQNPASVADRLSEVFMAGQMSIELKNTIVAGMNARTQASSETSGMTRTRDQIKLAEAIHFMLISPEYVVQK